MTTVTATAPPPPPPPQGGETYRLALPNTPVAAKIARDFVSSLLGTSSHRTRPELVDDARLCTTEVVTNAHRHTRTPLIRVHVTVGHRDVTVSVTDDRPWALPMPAPTATEDTEDGEDAEDAEGGRGISLVASLAVAWGATIYGGEDSCRKAIWFTLRNVDTATRTPG
ncbi:ATP-binding protein [Streptomyces sp. NPDC087850]|uniref:ATP-binding protein n=1 Tax=Streptomyces sp. NPDC087850 TaxID=3365809 RepID=UPI00381A9FD3